MCFLAIALHVATQFEHKKDPIPAGISMGQYTF
jgi:hypothetical protein